MRTNDTPKKTRRQDFDTITGGRGPWANAWHPSWGENGDQSEAMMESGDDAQEFSSDDKDPGHTNPPSS